MWFFNKKSEGESIIDELPEDLKDFFKTHNDIHRLQNIGLDEKINYKSANGYKQLSFKQREEFERFSSKNNINEVASTNCITLLQRYLNCMNNSINSDKSIFKDKGGMTECTPQRTACNSCVIRNKASLQEMGYDKAYTVEMKEDIQKISILLHDKHFGEDGMNVTKESLSNHWDDVMRARYDIWK